MSVSRAFLLMSIMTFSDGSIVGVTYMDHFDFETRYRDTNECDPFYWHPIHLPVECVEIFENLIRSNLAALGPLRVYSERSPERGASVEVHHAGYPQPSAAVGAGSAYRVRERRPSPIERMMEMLRHDAMTVPTAPRMQVAPLYGPVATYHQPVSRRSEKMIKDIAGAYRKSMLHYNSQINLQ